MTRVAQAAAIAFVAGGWWWIRNLVVLGRIQASLPAYESVDGVVTRPIWWIGRFGVWIVESFWGWMGWFEAKLPVAAIGVATGIVVITLLLALIDPGRRGSIRRGEVLFLLSPTLLIGAIVALRAYAVYADTGVTRGIQGRYFFPLTVVLAAVVASTWIALSGSYSRFVPSGVLAASASMQVAAFLTVIAAYYGTEGAALSARLDAWVWWSPAAPWFTIGALAGTIVLYAAAARATWQIDRASNSVR